MSDEVSFRMTEQSARRYSRPVSDRPKPTTERQGTGEPFNDDPLHLNKVVCWARQLRFCHEPSNGCGSKNGYGTVCIARDTILPSSAHDRSIRTCSPVGICTDMKNRMYLEQSKNE